MLWSVTLPLSLREAVNFTSNNFIMIVMAAIEYPHKIDVKVPLNASQIRLIAPIFHQCSLSGFI